MESWDRLLDLEVSEALEDISWNKHAMEAAKPKRKHKKKAKDAALRSVERHEDFQDSKGLSDLH